MAFPWNAPGGYGAPPQTYDGPSPGGYGVPFQGAPGMPFNGPAMYAGGDSNDGRGGRYDNRNRTGLGADPGRNVLDRERQKIQDNMAASQPPTREEVARSIFIGGLGDSAPPDQALESILRCAGKLRRWTRARDSNDKECRFGFAEYEDVDSLETARDLFGEGIEAPLYKHGKVDMGETQEGEEVGPKMAKLLVVIDEQSISYIVEWGGKRTDAEVKREHNFQEAQEHLRQCIFHLQRGALGYDKHEGALVAAANGQEDGTMALSDANGGSAVLDNSVSLDDELADIPAEMRATVTQEIKNFRDKSNRRELERMRQEQEYEATHSRQSNRLGSPAQNANGGMHPGVAGAPAGPKGFRGAQLPSDDVNGGAFASTDVLMEDDSDASDRELEARRKATKAEEQEKQFQDAERRWLNRERQRLAAQEREHTREEAEARDRERQKQAMARRFSTWNDEEEERSGREEYYYDRSAWARRRAGQRDREAREDDRDRQMDEREKYGDRRRDDDSRSAADRFLAETGAEMAAAKHTGGSFKISLGAGNRGAAQPAPKKTVQDMAGLLEEEEDAAEAGQRQLRTMPTMDITNAGGDMTDEERNAARQALASDIPTDSDSLFAWNVRWSYIGPELLEREIRPFVNKKVVEFLGIQEDFLVDMIINALKEQKPATALVSELSKILDDDAESLVKKVWRLVVYFGEAEGKGLL